MKELTIVKGFNEGVWSLWWDDKIVLGPYDTKKEASIAKEAYELGVETNVKSMNQAYSKDPVYTKNGNWYFWDETWANSEGPFSSEEDARIGLKEYVEDLFLYEYKNEGWFFETGKGNSVGPYETKELARKERIIWVKIDKDVNEQQEEKQEGAIKPELLFDARRGVMWLNAPLCILRICGFKPESLGKIDLDEELVGIDVDLKSGNYSIYGIKKTGMELIEERIL